MATNTSTLEQPKVQRQNRGQSVSKSGVNVGVTVLWIVGAAALWNVLLVLFHYVTDHLLGR